MIAELGDGYGWLSFLGKMFILIIPLSAIKGDI